MIGSNQRITGYLEKIARITGYVGEEDYPAIRDMLEKKITRIPANLGRSLLPQLSDNCQPPLHHPDHAPHTILIFLSKTIDICIFESKDSGH